MAARRLVVSELLCYLLYNYDKSSPNDLKRILVDFYTQPDIQEAKELLLGDANSLKMPEKLPRFARRSGVDNKGMAANDVDDIFTLIEILIQRDVLTKMPVYVILNPTDVPLKKMDWGEFSHLKGEMDTIVENQEKMSAVFSTLLETLDDHLIKILGHMSGTRDCLQNNIECVQSSVKSLDSVIENIQATQSIQCKQTQKLFEVQDSDE